MADALFIQQLREGKPWILLVDDDLHITQGLKDIREDSGYQVQTTHSGDEALAELKRHSFNLLVVDYSLPDTNGVELTRTVRVHYPDVMALLMTGHDRFEMQANDLTGLFCAFLRKPVEVQAVTAAIDEAARLQRERLNIQVMAVAVPEAPAPSIPMPVTKPIMLDEPLLAQEKMLWPWMLLTLAFGFGGGWFARGATHQVSPVPTPVPRVAPPVPVILAASPPTVVYPVATTGVTPHFVVAPTSPLTTPIKKWAKTKPRKIKSVANKTVIVPPVVTPTVPPTLKTPDPAEAPALPLAPTTETREPSPTPKADGSADLEIVQPSTAAPAHPAP